MKIMWFKSTIPILKTEIKDVEHIEAQNHGAFESSSKNLVIHAS